VSKKLIEKLRKDRDDYTATIERYAKRLEDGEELPEGDAKTLADCRAEAAALNDRIGELQAQETARLQAVMRDAEFDALQRAAAEHATGSAYTRDRPKSIGERFTSSEQFARFVAAGARGESGAFDVGFALIKSTDANAKQIAPVSRASDAPLPQYTTPLLDACGFETVSSTNIEWIEWPIALPLAGVVPEGTAKPEAVYAPVVKAGSLEKLAHRIPITDEFLQDNARMESIIGGALINGVKAKAEALAAAAIAGATLPTAEHETLLKAIRVGIATVQAVGFRPNAVVVNPMDYAEIDIELLAATMSGARRESPVWGLTVIPAPIVPAGTAYAGDLVSGVTTFARSTATLDMATQNADDWEKNIIQLRAEQRVKTVVVQPKALVKVSVAETP
jgi:HK97 family phage major capsid protein